MSPIRDDEIRIYHHIGGRIFLNTYTRGDRDPASSRWVRTSLLFHPTLYQLVFWSSEGTVLWDARNSELLWHCKDRFYNVALSPEVNSSRTGLGKREFTSGKRLPPAMCFIKDLCSERSQGLAPHCSPQTESQLSRTTRPRFIYGTPPPPSPASQTSLLSQLFTSWDFS